MRAFPRRLALGVLVAVAGSGVWALAQDRPVFRTGIDVVRVDVLVTDGGRPVAGLTAADFEVRDNGVPQAVDLAAQSGTVHVVQVLDTSGSTMGPTISQLKDAARTVVGLLQPGDRVSLLTFAERILLHAGATDDTTRVREAIDTITVGGGTSLRDALYAGLAFAVPDQGRTLLLLYSDGAENSSWLSDWDAVEAVRRSEVVIYAVGVVPPGRTPFGGPGYDPDGLMPQIAQRSGGAYVRTSREKPLSQVFADVLSEFRSRYLLTYSPKGVKRDDGWHSLSVKLKNRSGQVRARTGYLSSDRSPRGRDK